MGGVGSELTVNPPFRNSSGGLCGAVSVDIAILRSLVTMVRATSFIPPNVSRTPCKYPAISFHSSDKPEIITSSFQLHFCVTDMRFPSNDNSMANFGM